MAILATSISAAAKAAIAGNPKFNGVTPELSALIDALSDGIAEAVNAEIAPMKTTFNGHTHLTAAGASAPPLSPMV